METFLIFNLFVLDEKRERAKPARNNCSIKIDHLDSENSNFFPRRQVLEVSFSAALFKLIFLKILNEKSAKIVIFFELCFENFFLKSFFEDNCNRISCF